MKRKGRLTMIILAFACYGTGVANMRGQTPESVIFGFLTAAALMRMDAELKDDDRAP